MRLAAGLPEPLEMVPPLSTESFDRWAVDVRRPRELLGTVDPPTIDRDLAALVEAMRDPSVYQRTWLAAVPREPMQHGIPAVGWIAAAAAGGLTADDLIRRSEDPEWVRLAAALAGSLSMHEIGSNPVLVAHQFQPLAAASDEDGAVLSERCSALMLDVNLDVVIRVELVTYDMLLFDDIVGATLAVLESVSIVGDVS